MSTSVVQVLVKGCRSLLEDIQVMRGSLLICLFRLSRFIGSILYRCVYGCMFCILLFNFVNYVFVLFCYVFLLLYVCSLIVIYVIYVTSWVI